MTRSVHGLVVLAVFSVLLAPAIAPAKHGGPHVTPRQKNCVGDPPRQIEDPLGPPCVPFYDGPHPAGYHGVDRDEVRLVLYNDFGANGDLTLPYSPSDEPSASGPGQENVVRTLKAHVRYFQRRFQTYHRTVRITAVAATGVDCASQKADARGAITSYDPFGAIVLPADASCFVREIAGAHRLVFALGGGLSNRDLRAARPFAYSFFPHVEGQAQMSAGLICRSLAGSAARFAGPEYRLDDRTFGLIEPASGADGIARWAKRLERSVEAGCGERFHIETYERGLDPAEAVTVVAGMRTAGVSTIVCACPPVRDSEAIRVLRTLAHTAGYQPEWYFDSTSGMDSAEWRDHDLSGAGSVLGTSMLWRTPQLREQYHYGAYLQEEPGTQPNELHSFDSYHGLLLAFVAL